MSVEEANRSRISRFDGNDLLKLWHQIKAGQTEAIWKSGKAFEYLILRAFELEGAEVKWPFSVDIQGSLVEQIDGIVYSDGLSVIVESKDLAERVNIEPIAKLRNQLLRRPSGSIGVIFSRKGFTAAAVTLALFLSPQTILLWGGDEVAYALENRYMRQGLLAKYRYCVEQGRPDYNIREEKLP